MKTPGSTPQHWNAAYLLNKNLAWGDDTPAPILRAFIEKALQKWQKSSQESSQKSDKNTIRVLDIGCGNGRNSQIFDGLSGCRADYTGIDFSHEAVQQCKRNYPDRNFLVADAAAPLELPSESYDIIIDHGCLHSLPPERRAPYAENILSITRPGALLVLGAWYRGEADIPTAPRQDPDFLPCGFLEEWFVGEPDIEVLFGQSFELIESLIDTDPPHDINQGLLYCLLKRQW